MLNVRVAAGLLLLLTLAACSSQPGKPTTTKITTPKVEALSAIEALIAKHRLKEAEDNLLAIEPLHLSALKQIHFHWLDANLAVALGRGAAAMTALNSVSPGAFGQLTHLAPQAPGLLRAKALHLQAQYIASARERMFLAGALGDTAAYLTNHEAIWASLLQANEQQLTSLTRKSSTPTFKGWLELTLIIKRTQIDLDRQLNALRQWQVKYRQHPAAKQLPGDLSQIEDYVESRAEHIALMLPLSGKLASTGKALRDGLMAAYYQALQAGADVPEIKFYDTAKSKDFWALYQQAIRDGNELVIGPLEKKSVIRLQQEEQLPVPTLALNYGKRDQSENPKLLFQFGLAVEDEAELASHYARQQGYQRAVVLAPKGSWGERVFNRFSRSWQAQGGELIEAQFFSGKADYNKVIARLMSVDDSERRARNLRRQLGVRLEFQARRRQDVDFIFVAALPHQARQIKPTLAFNFAKNIPVLATSQIYSGKKSRKKDRDLENVVFCDIPWVLDNPPLRKKIQALWPNTRSGLDRLYALGLDAYRLHPRLGQISVLSQSTVQGQSGQLTMDRHGQIIRNLPFAQFKKGLAKKIQAPLVIQSGAHAQSL
ncbi:MAG: penicillin-binding protein activator [Bermanella sp.]